MKFRAFEWFRAIGLAPRSRDDWAALHAIPVSEARPGYVATCSGRLFDVVNPDPREIEIDEIAHALSMINRFAGHTKFPYSVGQHSVLCAVESLRRYPDDYALALCLLLHDAPEAYCCDIIRPVKRLIRSVYRPIEERIWQAICRRFDLRIDERTQARIHEIDNAVVYVESHTLMHGAEGWNWSGVTPASVGVVPWEWRRTRHLFMCYFDYLDYFRNRSLAQGA